MVLLKRDAPVLIAEDDQKTGTLVATYLEREGFRTRISRDGREALELARRETPLLVILDLNLPGADGWEVCQTLRRHSDVPILILSARQEELDRILGFTLGADDYVMKPRFFAAPARNCPPPGSGSATEAWFWTSRNGR